MLFDCASWGSSGRKMIVNASWGSSSRKMIANESTRGSPNGKVITITKDTVV